jgi:hypothetical protein
MPRNVISKSDTSASCRCAACLIQDDDCRLFFSDKHTLAAVFKEPNYASVHEQPKKTSVTLKQFWRVYKDDCSRKSAVTMASPLCGFLTRYSWRFQLLGKAVLITRNNQYWATSQLLRQAFIVRFMTVYAVLTGVRKRCSIITICPSDVHFINR